jgi:hypothetical protein
VEHIDNITKQPTVMHINLERGRGTQLIYIRVKNFCGLKAHEYFSIPQPPLPLSLSLSNRVACAHFFSNYLTFCFCSRLDFENFDQAYRKKSLFPNTKCIQCENMFHNDSNNRFDILDIIMVLIMMI